jgi:MFS transporter, AAHS family, 4-hydroxybenzoate transporter
MTTTQQQQPIDPSELLDRSPWTVYQKLLTALVAAAIIVDGFDIQILAFSIPSLSADWHLTRSAFAPVLALGLVGMAVGGPVFGYLGDQRGRRPALIGAITLFALATLATAFIQGITPLTILRFVTGFGAGGAVPGASALAAEFAPLLRRAVAVKLTILCVPLGGMLGGLVAAQVLPALGWRTLYLIGGGLPLLLAVVLGLVLPESPRFLAQRRSGWQRLTQFLSRAGHSLPAETSFTLPARSADEPVSAAELFSPSLARNTAGLWIAFFFSLGSVYLVFGWLPALLVSQGLAVSAASTGLATYNLGGVIGVLIWAMLTAVCGSRAPLMVGALAASASAAALWFIPARQGVVLALAIGLHGLLANAIQTSLYALAAHVYPTRVRALGVAGAATLGRIGGILSSLTGAALITRGAGAYWGTIAAAMIFAFAGLAIVRRHIPHLVKPNAFERRIRSS